MQRKNVRTFPSMKFSSSIACINYLNAPFLTQVLTLGAARQDFKHDQNNGKNPTLLCVG